MITKCPYCGRKITVNGLGRKRLNIPFINVCESLQTHGSVLGAANDLNCSKGYIFGVLKANGLKLKDVMNGKGLATKDMGMLHKQGVRDGRQE